VNVGSSVDTLSQSPTGGEVICGTADGKLIALCDPNAQQEEMHLRLEELGISDVYG
jgi:hypothetical protein